MGEFPPFHWFFTWIRKQTITLHPLVPPSTPKGNLSPLLTAQVSLTWFQISHCGVAQYIILLSVCLLWPTQHYLSSVFLLLGVLCLFLLLDRVLWYDCATIHSLFILLLMDVWQVSSFRRLRTMLLCHPVNGFGERCAQRGSSGITFPRSLSPARSHGRVEVRSFPSLSALGPALLLHFSHLWDPAEALICISLLIRVLSSSSYGD